MATYEEIYGKRVKEFDSDPTLESSYEGQVWYDKSSGVLKSVVAVEAWSSSGVMGSGRYALGGAGSQTAALGFAGYASPPPPGYSEGQKTEEYNGSGWATGGNLTGAARYYIGGCGTQTAGLAFGGNSPGTGRSALTEEYNGTSWSESGDLSVARRSLGSAGVQTAAAAFGGDINAPGVAPQDKTEEYNGTSWTNGGDLNTPRGGGSNGGPIGTQDATLYAGGFSTPSNNRVANVEEYNGTSWTTVTALPGGRTNSAVAGTQTDGLLFGGNLPPQTNTAFKYDGTSWTSAPNLGAAVKTHAGAGTAAAALSFGGNPSSGTGATEEFTKSANVITAAAFSSLPSLSTSRWGLGGAGTKSAAIVFGGRNPPVGQDLARSEEYSGSSWSEGPDLNTATRVCGRGTGTQTAALKHGGHSGSPSTSNKTAEEWDGSSWTNGGTSTNKHDGTSNLGTQTAAASCGSNPPTAAKTEEYNGTSFSTANDMPYAAYQLAASGSQTAGLVFGGGYPSVTTSANYDGTNWTSGPALVQATLAHAGNGGGGTQTEAIGAAGYRSSPAAYLNNSFTYDGTNFATGPNVGTARSELAGQGANSSFYIAGGLLPPGSASGASEEFTAETTTITAATLTSS